MSSYVFDHSHSSSGSSPTKVILGLWEYSRKYYTLFVGVLHPRILPVYDEYTTFVGVLPQNWYICNSGSSPKQFKIMHWERS